jgi:hypothetical protein
MAAKLSNAAGMPDYRRTCRSCWVSCPFRATHLRCPLVLNASQIYRSNTLVAGTLADIYEARTRGWIMACFSLSIFLVIAISVWLGDVIVLNLGWRWIGWIQLIISLSLTISYIPLLPETRGNTILYHKKLKLEKTTGKKHRALGEEERQQKWTALIRTSLVRPACEHTIPK